MRVHSALVLSACLLLVSVVACAPAAPSPTLAPSTPTSSAPAVTSKATSVASPDDAAWTKVAQAAKKEGVLTVYGYYYPSDIGQAVSQAFKDKYGIRVEILTVPGRQIVERLKVEHQINKPVADVTNLGTSSATELSVAGMGESVWRELPSLRDKGVFFVDPVYSPNGDVLFMFLNVLAPLVNTQKVTPQDEPRSYRDFLKPRWQGRILATDPRGGGGGMFTTFTTLRHFQVLDDDYWRRLAPTLKLWGGSDHEGYKMIGRGEYDMSLFSADASVAYIIAEGAPLKLLVMEEGNVVQGQATMALKNAPHPNAARLFTDWVFSAEGQTVYAKAASVTALRRDVPSFLFPGARIEPKKFITRTWEAAEASNEYQKAGIVDQFFGKK